MTKVNSKLYWEARYKNGGTSGWGSHNISSVNFKKDYINSYIRKIKAKTLVELGCGDGNQLSYFDGYQSYSGYDISETIINKCQIKFKNDNTKSFTSNINDLLNKEKYDIALSLDVTYHLIEEDVYKNYLNNLFNLSNFVIIFGVDNNNVVSAKHVKNRMISEYVIQYQKKFQLVNTKMFNENVGFFTYKCLK